MTDQRTDRAARMSLAAHAMELAALEDASTSQVGEMRTLLRAYAAALRAEPNREQLAAFQQFAEAEADRMERVQGEEREEGWTFSLCANCGPYVAVDEDGCCSTCGNTAVGIFAQDLGDLLRKWVPALARRSPAPEETAEASKPTADEPEVRDGPLEARDVIRRLCKLQSRVALHVGCEYAADCFCGEGGLWATRSYGGTHDEGYRNDGEALRFIEQAVDEALTAQKKPSEPTADAGGPMMCCTQCDWVGEDTETIWTDSEHNEVSGEDDECELSCPKCKSSFIVEIEEVEPRQQDVAGGDEDVRRLMVEAICARGLASRCEGRSEAGDEAYTDDMLAEKWAEHEIAEKRAFAALDRLIAGRDRRTRERDAAFNENTRLRRLVEDQRRMIEDMDRQHVERDGTA